MTSLAFSIYHPRPERWPQVNLKGLFVLVAVAGVFCWWLGIQVRWIRDRNAAVNWNTAILFQNGHRPSLEFSDAFGDPPWVDSFADAPLSIRIFGARGARTIWVVENYAGVPADHARLLSLFPEADFIFNDARGNIEKINRHP